LTAFGSHLSRCWRAEEIASGALNPVGAGEVKRG
jgi:hypothetical protein